jgi:TM2 domain-containing membrane protein YozV
MDRKRTPGAIPEPGWTVQEHDRAAAAFWAGSRAGGYPQWPPPRESLTADGRVTAPGYLMPAPGYLVPAAPVRLVPVRVEELPVDQAARRAEQATAARRLNPVIAYLLCIFLGILGLHRFYLRRTGSGLAMLLVTVLTAGAGLLVTLPWAVVDLFLIPGIIRQEDARVRDDAYRRYGLALGPGRQAGPSAPW